MIQPIYHIFSFLFMDPRGCSVLFSFAFLSSFQEQWWNDITYLSYSLKILHLHACCVTKVKAPRSLRECCLPVAQAFMGLHAKLCCITRFSPCKAKDGGLEGRGSAPAPLSLAPEDVFPGELIPPGAGSHLAPPLWSKIWLSQGPQLG